MNRILQIALLIIISSTTEAQNMAINNDGTKADTSAILHLKSTNRGLLLPQMTEGQRNTIYLPATGLLIYQTDNVPGFYNNSGTAASPVWTRLQDAASNYWTKTGTTIYNNNTGNVGIGTATPNSTLQVDGGIAVGISMGLAGGTNAVPVSLAGQKTYIGCSPADNINNFYQLPDPATVPGRIYYIRNNSSSFFANIVTAAGNIFPGNSNTAAGGNTYTLNPTSSVKTVICISDGVNWTVGRID